MDRCCINCRTLEHCCGINCCAAYQDASQTLPIKASLHVSILVYAVASCIIEKPFLVYELPRKGMHAQEALSMCCWAISKFRGA